jgi:glycogen(starch) synthase
MQDATMTPRFSIVINTNGRCESLERTIESFRQVDYPAFELCVVYGPSRDGTADLVLDYLAKGVIKAQACPDRNLSQSRNLGIAMASGDIVAFIDDDAIPEPEWLTDLAAAFKVPQIAAAGGKVYDPSGFTAQYLYSACDRLGNAKLDLSEAATEYNFPFSNVFPYVQGTNAAIRRSVLVEIGGFDEEYEFYLDETDVCCRLVDIGYGIAQLPNAVVHHKFLPSHLRNEARITTVRYPVIKNKIYFSLINNHGHFSLDHTLRDAARFVDHHRADLRQHVVAGYLASSVLDDFEQDTELAWKTGLQRGLSGERRTRPAAYFEKAGSFLPFPTCRAEGHRMTFVFLSPTYPPAGMDGVARYTLDISQAISGLGHGVHVITRSETANTVDLEDGVWVHRLVPKAMPPCALPSGTTIPRHIVNQSGTALEEIYRIARARPVDVVEGASWDCECILTLLNGRFASVTNIVTTLSHWLETHKDYRGNAEWMSSFGTPMLEVERYLFEHSQGIVAASQQIARSIEERYGNVFAPEQLGYIPHGLRDMRPMLRSKPSGLDTIGSATLKILFVGRLELRKGIDVLLDAALDLLLRHQTIEFWFAGDDQLVLDGGMTARTGFEDRAAKAGIAPGRARFFGRVNDLQLRWLYATCDIYVSPSRYESFGLIFVEAMMFEKPCIGPRTGGAQEVIEENVDGLLVEPGNLTSLIDALDRLIVDPSLRHRLGVAGRRNFERKFDVSVVVEARIRFLAGFRRIPLSDQAIRIFGPVQTVDVGFGQKGMSLGRKADLIFTTDATRIHFTFWVHAWSGFAEIWANDEPVEQVDLYSKHPEFRTVTLSLPNRTREVRLRRLGRLGEGSEGDEIIFHSVAVSNPPGFSDCISQALVA